MTVESLVEQRRESLLQAALELFVEQGYHHTKVADIVQRVGVSQGTFYNYFPNKRSAFDALMDSWFEPFWRFFDQDLGHPVSSMSELEQIALRHWTILLRLYADRPLLARFILKHSEGVSPDVTARLEEFRERYADLFERSARKRQEAGEIRIFNARVFAHALVGAFERLAIRWFVIGEAQTMTPEELAGPKS